MNLCKRITSRASTCAKICSSIQNVSDHGRYFSTTSQASMFSLFKSKSGEPKGFGNYNIVRPATVAPRQTVPENILKPPYAETMKPPKPPKKIEIHSDESIGGIKRACRLARNVLDWVGPKIEIGMTTDEIDKMVHAKIIANNAYPSPLNYMGFPKSVCTSVNNVACHGIPDNRPLEDGDIINVDITVFLHGYHGDCSETYLIGNVDEQGRELVDFTKHCLYQAIAACENLGNFSNIGSVVETEARRKGFNVIPAFAGHGIGTYFHGPPDIYHCFNNFGGTMTSGMIFTIEPILSQGTQDVVILEDGWTAVTVDTARTAQFEHTILITNSGVEILTESEK